MSLQDDVFSESDQTIVPVPTPEWPKVDGKLFAKSLSALEMDQWQQKGSKAKAEGMFFNFRAVLVQMGTVDGSGAQVFDAASVGSIAGRNAAPVDRLWEAIWTTSGQDKAAKDAIVKNSETAPGDGSQSD